MKFEEIKVEFEKFESFDIIAESNDAEATTAPKYSNEGANDPYENDKF